MKSAIFEGELCPLGYLLEVYLIVRLLCGSEIVLSEGYAGRPGKG